MLNKFRIGTKLMIGFILLIFLILLSGGVGYYCLGLVSKEVEYMNDLANINRQANDMLDQSNAAQLASLRFARTKQDSFTKDVNDNIESILKNIQPLSEDIKANPRSDSGIADEVAKIETEATNYKTEHASYVALNVENEAARALRRKTSGEVDETIQTLIAQIDERTKAIAAENDGKIPVERVQVTKGMALALESTEKIRRASRDIDIYLSDEEKRKSYHEEVKSLFEYVKKVLNETKPDLSEANQRLADETCKNLDLWQEKFNEALEASLAMQRCDDKKSEIAIRFAEASSKTLELLRNDMADCEKTVSAIDSNASYAIIVALAFGVVLGIVLALVLSRNITTGIVKAVGALNLLAHEGDISIEIPAEDRMRADEIGDLSKAADSILNDYKNIGAMAESLANGDWRVEIKEKSPADAMNQNLNRMLEQVNHALAEINESVKQVNTGAGEVSSASQTLSSGAQESAASLEEITASMSEISSQTKTNAESAGQARDLAQGATKAATEGQEAMQEMTGAMERITQNSTEIQRVIKVIDDIAFQTNLLALNAAVEAARAGVHGKGFAVVAEEVRNLAARSAKAAAETTDLISKSGQEIGNGGAVAERTSEVLNAIADQIKQTTDLVAGIAVASNEQAQGVAQVTVGLQQIDAVTQQNTAAAEESASAANEMSGMASTLQQLVAKFKLRS